MKNIGLLLITTLFFSCGNKVETFQPKVGSITESVYAVGTIKAQHQYEAHSLGGGLIEEIYVQEGDTISIGAALLKISNNVQQLNRANAELNASFSDYSANEFQLEEAKQNIQLLKIKLETDSLNFIRQKNLWKQNIGSKVELEQRELAFNNTRTSYFSALMRYDNLKRQLKLASQQSKNALQIVKNQEGDFILKSEVNGMIYKIYPEKGELINQQTPLILLGDKDHYVLEMQVDESDIFKVRVGQKVLVTMDSYKGKVFEAIVSKVDKLMNERSKSFSVEANFTKAPEKLYPFISFEANILLQEKKDALIIPRNALYNDSFVIKANGDTVSVKLGLKDYRMVEILKGLTKDDEFILP